MRSGYFFSFLFAELSLAFLCFGGGDFFGTCAGWLAPARGAAETELGRSSAGTVGD